MCLDIPAILQSAANTPGLLKEIYGDLAKPGVMQVGKALSTVLGFGNTLLLPLTLVNERARLVVERNLEKYRQQLESVPDDQIANIPPEIGVPITEKLSYVSDDDVSDLYINLLAKASTIPTAQFAHPSFTNVISNLSPDEALLIKEFKNVTALPFIDVQVTINKATGEFIKVLPLLTGLELQVKMHYPNNIGAYLSNLEGLGLLNVRHDIHFAGDEIYKKLEGMYGSAISDITTAPEARLSIAKGKIEISPYGRLFVSACGRKLNGT